jgi:16S rRNA (guanine527-N7)-methyltransferase
MSLEPQLRAGAAELGLALDDGQVDKLLQYRALLDKWGKVYNLTAVRDAGEMLTHHLLDSLAIVAPLRRHTGSIPIRLLDVGSGAGLPGVVVAICCPEIRVDCLDAVAKKAAFVQQAAGTLRLPNLRGVHGRVEQVRDAYEVVSSRAFASLADFVDGSRAALAPGGTWLAMKGKHPDAEIAALPHDVSVFHVEQLRVPGLDAERCIVWMRPGPADH